MRSKCSVGVLTLAFSTFLTLAIDGASSRKRKQKEDVWLSDLVDYDYMGDAPAAGSDYCPPVPSVLPVGSCSRTPCNSDRACANGDGKCCYNGCIYTCLFQVGPPGYFDWTKEPRRLLSSGRSWLIDNGETVTEAEPCTTTPVDEDEDPLLCPHGYVCSIQDQGDVKKGIPNRGHCVLETDENDSNEEGEPTQRPYLVREKTDRQMRRNKICEEKNGFMVLEGATFQRNGKNCSCHKGKVICRRRGRKRA